jgi:hypothetical protein
MWRNTSLSSVFGCAMDNPHPQHANSICTLLNTIFAPLRFWLAHLRQHCEFGFEQLLRGRAVHQDGHHGVQLVHSLVHDSTNHRVREQAHQHGHARITTPAHHTCLDLQCHGQPRRPHRNGGGLLSPRRVSPRRALLLAVPPQSRTATR